MGGVSCQFDKMETLEGLNNKILEERQVEKFSQFIEKYDESVAIAKAFCKLINAIKVHNRRN